MKRYKNLAGNSGVTFYETGDDYIIIEFKDTGKYLYNYSRPGKLHVAQMKQLAEAGAGLSSYINRYVRNNYARHLS